MNIAIVGAGLIGHKRANSLDLNSDNLVKVCDNDLDKAKKLGEKFDANWTSNIDDISNHDDIDIVIISVINKYTMPIAKKMLESKKHVLCEKPLGRNLKESQIILKASKENNRFVKTGFNHRFHPSIMKAKSILNNGKLGDIINMRGRYGHGGRPRMENEWRCSKDLCGGGELLDQGIHLIDLANYFFQKKIDEVFGILNTSFWKTDVEDNAFFNLKSQNVVAQFHASWTNWRNIFSFEIFCTNGYLLINGLGGNYGLERLEVGYRNEKGGAPKTQKYDFQEEDNSWSYEWMDFKSAIIHNLEPNGSGHDGLIANQIIEGIYKSNTNNRPYKLI